VAAPGCPSGQGIGPAGVRAATAVSHHGAVEVGSERVAEVAAALRATLPDLLIALDFDGTLAPIVADPAAARPLPGTGDALRALARAGAAVAVITGRDARTVLELGGFDAVPGVLIAGLYGAESWQDGALHTMPDPPAIADARVRLPGLVAELAADPGVWVEDKRLSLVVHTRRAAEPERQSAALRPALAALAGELGLQIHDGKHVLELRLPGFDKGGVLDKLVARTAPRGVLFAGDDLGDLPAFAAIRRLRDSGRVAWSVVSAGDEVPGEVRRAADLSLDGPAGVLELLLAILG
jgi:trehalose 6-phosphate phosphatase